MAASKSYFAIYYDLETNRSYATAFGDKNHEPGELLEFENIEFVNTFENKKTKPTFVYINDAETVAKIFEKVTGEKLEHLKEHWDASKRKQTCYEFEVKNERFNIRFLSFDDLLPAGATYEMLKKEYKTERNDFAMFCHIKSNGGTKAFKGTWASISQKMFYTPDLVEHLKNQQRIYIEGLEDWKRLYSGARNGWLKNIKEAEYYQDVIAYDVTAAYLEVQLFNSEFPLKVKQLKGKHALRKLSDVLLYNQTSTDGRMWFKLIFDIGSWERIFAEVLTENFRKDNTFNPVSGFKYQSPEDYIKRHRRDNDEVGFLWRMLDKKTKLAAFEIADTDLYNLYGFQWQKIIEKVKGSLFLYYSEPSLTGHLDDELRKKAYELRLREVESKKIDKQNGFKSLNTTILKSMRELLYGKPMTYNEKKAKYDTSYLKAVHSNHCCSVVRYKMAEFEALAMIKSGQKSIYYDTDSHKFQRTSELVRFVETYNKEIMKRNEQSGFPCDVGTFKLEGIYEEFMLFAPKCYAYTEDRKLNITCAGLPDECKEIFETEFQPLLDEKGMFLTFKKGIPFAMKYLDLDNIEKHFEEHTSLVQYITCDKNGNPYYICRGDDLAIMLSKGEKYVDYEEVREQICL